MGLRVLFCDSRGSPCLLRFQSPWRNLQQPSNVDLAVLTSLSQQHSSAVGDNVPPIVHASPPMVPTWDPLSLGCVDPPGPLRFPGTRSYGSLSILTMRSGLPLPNGQGESGVEKTENSVCGFQLESAVWFVSTHDLPGASLTAHTLITYLSPQQVYFIRCDLANGSSLVHSHRLQNLHSAFGL